LPLNGFVSEEVEEVVAAEPRREVSGEETGVKAADSVYSGDEEAS
jgi:hypothetical protein